MNDPMSMAVVQEAIERHRQKLDDSLAQRKAQLSNSLGTLSPSEIVNDISGIANAARELGSLDAVCALYGITENVATRRM